MAPLPSLRLLWPSILLAITAILPPALAHSHINYILINGLLYRGFDPTGRSGATPANTIGWSTTADGDEFVPPSNYSTPDIICHRDGAPAKSHAPVKAGDRIHIQWNGWPQSHHGPVLSYLAPCGGSDGCASVDGAQLNWTKIDNSAPALLSETGGPPGNWATDVLIASNNSWLVGIPAGLAPGPYVLRHEIIALHYANKPDGAQNYPQCLNLWVEGETGGGAAVAAGATEVLPGAGATPATKLYRATDPGVSVDIYKTLTTYAIPGPTVVSGAAPVAMAEQKMVSLSRGDGTPVLVKGTQTVAFPSETPGGHRVRR
ncbi:glycosyl hydrolase family 61-domain-containing protein [Bombardia bombarda]|uniref:lytic cellulose monooxygenase (C4-dehydrogenating) n=1 Tax=Bombardia bombarda TaxID=252184 RepID=A0AA39XCY3_9PEZI|nr:glycosyl hydrolase family 61-domain-containing protein [Bombardia bombarda]